MVCPPTSRRHRRGSRSTRRRPRLADRIGPWIGTLTAVDDSSCILDTGADSLEMLAVYLGLLGVDFTVSEPPELVQRIQALGERYTRATGAAPATQESGNGSTDPPPAGGT